MTEDGYAGKLLEIDLTKQEVTCSPLPEAYRRQYLGGKALAAQLLWENTSGRETSFSEDNLFVIAAAPLTGTELPGSFRFDVVSLSPKDDQPAFSNCGGNLGHYLKQSGYDALIFRGKAASPQWVEISEKGVCFHDAGEWWGLGTGQCRNRLEECLQGKHFASLCIGPAGEHLVKYASLVADGHSTGHAGLGAVLGWKQLKAVTVTGKREDSAGYDPKETYCRGCSLHCTRHSEAETAVLEELGLDAVAAENAKAYACQQGWETENLYEAIAFRTGAGQQLAEYVAGSRGKGGKRRKGSYGQIARAFGLSLEEKSTEEFCKNLMEAISVCGQCMLTVNAFHPGMESLPILHHLERATGQSWNLEKLLILGKTSRELEAGLKARFSK